MAIDHLLTELRAQITTRQHGGITDLAERVGPSEWAAIIPHLEPSEDLILIRWLPDDELPDLLAELNPTEAAAILRTLNGPSGKL